MDRCPFSLQPHWLVLQGEDHQTSLGDEEEACSVTQLPASPGRICS